MKEEVFSKITGKAFTLKSLKSPVQPLLGSSCNSSPLCCVTTLITPVKEANLSKEGREFICFTVTNLQNDYKTQ